MVWSGTTGNGLDPVYRAALAGPHQIYSRVDVTDSAGNVLQSDLPFSAGTVSATLQQRVVRTCKLTVDSSWFPVNANGTVNTSAPLAPFGNRIKAYRGIDWGTGQITYFPAFTGSLDTVELSRDGSVAITAQDLAGDVVAAGFEAPTSSAGGVQLQSQFKTLISGAIASATFGTSDATVAVMPALTWEYDRGKALDDVASAAGMIWYQLPDGSFVMRLLPWTKTGAFASVTASDSDLLSDYKITVTRQNVYNSVVFTSERQGSTPVYAVARDTALASVTRWSGPFGKRPVLVQNQVPLSQAQCVGAAKTRLNSAKAITVQFGSTSITPDASLELGDLINVTAGGVTSVQCVTGFELPLRETGAMPLTLRAYTPLS